MIKCSKCNMVFDDPPQRVEHICVHGELGVADVKTRKEWQVAQVYSYDHLMSELNILAQGGWDIFAINHGWRVTTPSDLSYYAPSWDERWTIIAYRVKVD